MTKLFKRHIANLLSRTRLVVVQGFQHQDGRFWRRHGDNVVTDLYKIGNWHDSRDQCEAINAALMTVNTAADLDAALLTRRWSMLKYWTGNIARIM